MAVVSIRLPEKLVLKLKERAEETGYLPEELAFEFLRKSLNEEIDPEELAEHYKELSEKYLEDGRESLNKGDLVQASEKLWGAAALEVKRIAASRGLRLDKHGAIWSFVSRLSKETGDKELILLFHAANGLHFYENELDKEAVKVTAESVEKLIEKLRRIQ